MKFLAVVTPPPAIFCDCSTRKAFLKEKFTPVNMKICERHNVGKHREIKNGVKYIILDISYNIDCMENREVTSSDSKDFMGIPGKSLTT